MLNQYYYIGIDKKLEYFNNLFKQIKLIGFFILRYNKNFNILSKYIRKRDYTRAKIPPMNRNLANSRLPIIREQKKFDNHKKPRFCPQPHTDDHNKHVWNHWKTLCVMERGIILVKDSFLPESSACSVWLPHQKSFIVRVLLAGTCEARNKTAIIRS